MLGGISVFDRLIFGKVTNKPGGIRRVRKPQNWRAVENILGHRNTSGMFRERHIARGSIAMLNVTWFLGPLRNSTRYKGKSSKPVKSTKVY